MVQQQLPQHIPSTQLVRLFNASPPGKLFCLHGDRCVFRLSLYALSQGLLAGKPIALVDGTNRFDAYYIAEFARRAASYHFGGIPTFGVTPESLLKNIFVSRAFTCYQMEAAVTERLPAFLEKKNSSVAVIFGLLDTFYDEQAPVFEARASVQRIIASLRILKKKNVSVLLASLDLKLASRERNALSPKLIAAMDESYTMIERENGPTIFRDSKLIQERRSVYGTHSSDIHHGHSTGNGKLVKIPAGSPQGGSGGPR